MQTLPFAIFSVGQSKPAYENPWITTAAPTNAPSNLTRFTFSFVLTYYQSKYVWAIWPKKSWNCISGITWIFLMCALAHENRRINYKIIKGPKNTLSSLVKNYDLVFIFYHEICSFAHYNMAVLGVQSAYENPWITKTAPKNKPLNFGEIYIFFFLPVFFCARTMTKTKSWNPITI